MLLLNSITCDGQYIVTGGRCDFKCDFTRFTDSRLIFVMLGAFT